MILSILLFGQNSARPIVWSAVGICAGLYFFFNGFRVLQRRHLVLNTPVSKIRGAAMGMVEISGLAAGPHTIVAPITARPCYFYRTIVWEWKRQGRSNRWVKVAGECIHVPFFLDDNTGKVLIDPSGAELDLHRDFQQEFCDSFFTMKEEAPPNVHSFLSRHGVSTTNKIKVEEYCIKPKNSLFVMGTLAGNTGLELAARPIIDREHDTQRTAGLNLTTAVLGQAVLEDAPDSVAVLDRSVSESLMRRSFGGTDFGETNFHKSPFATSALGQSILQEESMRAAAAQVIHITPNPVTTKTTEMTQQQKIAAALMKAGISNPAAWSAAGVMGANASAGVAISADGASTEGFELRPPVVLMKGKNNPMFLISWRSQREIAKSLGWKCTLMIWGGPALAVLSLYILLASLHGI
jgi:E3 Ubiquitin ligase